MIDYGRSYTVRAEQDGDRWRAYIIGTDIEATGESRRDALTAVADLAFARSGDLFGVEDDRTSADMTEGPE